MKPIIHNGQVMKLDHLAPFTFHCPCPDINRDISIRAQFVNHHCYTRKYDPAIHDADEIIITEAKGRHRVFCPVRYELSHHLPKLIPELPNSKVHQTSQSRNYAYVVPLEIGGNPYEIYFMLQRAAPDDAADLRLTVESAYRSDGPLNLRKRPKRNSLCCAGAQGADEPAYSFCAPVNEKGLPVRRSPGFGFHFGLSLSRITR